MIEGIQQLRSNPKSKPFLADYISQRESLKDSHFNRTQKGRRHTFKDTHSRGPVLTWGTFSEAFRSEELIDRFLLEVTLAKGVRTQGKGVGIGQSVPPHTGEK